jgi:hypothetical protein
MHAASLKFAELAIATGIYPAPPGFPIIPVADGAGYVIAVGDEVNHVSFGDWVGLHPKPEWIARASRAEEAGAFEGSPFLRARMEALTASANTLVRDAGPSDLGTGCRTTDRCDGGMVRTYLRRHWSGSTVTMLGTDGLPIYDH